MEGFLIFLAIIAIQMIAAYAKQKKAAAAKQQQSQPQPVEYEMPTWDDEEEAEEIEEKEPELRQAQLPAVQQSAAELVEAPIFIPPQIHKRKFKIGNVQQGIIWTAILQEPRYKAKWKPVCSR